MESTAAKRSGSDDDGGKARGGRWRWCLGAVGAVAVAVVVIVIILGFTVFKPKRPVTAVDSVALKDLRASLDIPNLSVHLNLTLDLALSVTNPNKVGFAYSNSSALLLYKGDAVGEAPIPAGRISAGSTVPMNLTLTLLADRLLSHSGVYSDVASGALPLTTSTTMSGRVSVLKLFRLRVVSRATCDLTVSVSNQSVAQSDCKYDTKL